MKKEIHIYTNATQPAPVIYLNLFEGDGSEVWEECLKLKVPDCTLAAIGNIEWDREMTPWKADPVWKGDDFRGEAEDYLRELVEEILPETEKKLANRPLWSGLAGYSLGGLFAVYASYGTNVFRGIVSASGSLWYPDFTEFAERNQPSGQLESAYFSLGDKESRVKNPLMATTLDRTLKVKEILSDRGICTVFEENPGNHFTDPAGRTAKGIRWLLENTK